MSALAEALHPKVASPSNATRKSRYGSECLPLESILTIHQAPSWPGSLPTWTGLVEGDYLQSGHLGLSAGCPIFAFSQLNALPSLCDSNQCIAEKREALRRGKGEELELQRLADAGHERRRVRFTREERRHRHEQFAHDALGKQGCVQRAAALADHAFDAVLEAQPRQQR